MHQEVNGNYSAAAPPSRVCVCQHMPGRKWGSNGTMKDDALFLDIAIQRVCVRVFRLVCFDTLIRLFRQQFTFKLGKCRFNYNCLKYGATFLFFLPHILSCILMFRVCVMTQSGSPICAEKRWQACACTPLEENSHFFYVY